METISNVASAASKAIWGENNPQATTQGNETHGQEPISGQQGKGTVNEPFDQGNSGKQILQAQLSRFTHHAHVTAHAYRSFEH